MITLTREEAHHVLDALEVAPFISNGDDVAYHDKAIQTLRARLAEPEKEQEPVAWMLEWSFNGEETGQRLYDDERHCLLDAQNDGGICRPLYTAPPKREWHGLTDEEVVERANAEYDPENFARGVAWASIKLKEKNT